MNEKEKLLQQLLGLIKMMQYPEREITGTAQEFCYSKNLINEICLIASKLNMAEVEEK